MGMYCFVKPFATSYNLIRHTEKNIIYSACILNKKSTVWRNGIGGYTLSARQIFNWSEYFKKYGNQRQRIKVKEKKMENSQEDRDLRQKKGNNYMNIIRKDRKMLRKYLQDKSTLNNDHWHPPIEIGLRETYQKIYENFKIRIPASEERLPDREIRRSPQFWEYVAKLHQGNVTKKLPTNIGLREKNKNQKVILDHGGHSDKRNKIQKVLLDQERVKRDTFQNAALEENNFFDKLNEMEKTKSDQGVHSVKRNKIENVTLDQTEDSPKKNKTENAVLDDEKYNNKNNDGISKFSSSKLDHEKLDKLNNNFRERKFTAMDSKQSQKSKKNPLDVRTKPINQDLDFQKDRKESNLDAHMYQNSCRIIHEGQHRETGPLVVITEKISFVFSVFQYSWRKIIFSVNDLFSYFENNDGVSDNFNFCFENKCDIHVCSNEKEYDSFLNYKNNSDETTSEGSDNIMDETMLDVGDSMGKTISDRGGLNSKTAETISDKGEMNMDETILDEDENVDDNPEEEIDDFSDLTDVEEEFQNVKPAWVPPVPLKRGKHGVFDIEDLVTLLKAENAKDLCVIKMPLEAQLSEYMVIASAMSPRHLLAISHTVSLVYKRRKSKKDPFMRREGKGVKNWIAFDMENIILHIFMPEIRELYDLEMLWTVGPKYDDLSQDEDINKYSLNKSDVEWLQDLNISNVNNSRKPTQKMQKNKKK